MLLTKFDHDKIFHKDATVYTIYRFVFKLVFATEETFFHFPFLTSEFYKCVENFNIIYIGRLISEYPEIKTPHMLYNRFKLKIDISKVITDSERQIILDIFQRHGISDTKIQNELLNECIYYFIFCDVTLFIKHEKVKRLRFVLKKILETQIFMSKLPNISLLVSFFSKNDLFTEEKELMAIKRMNNTILKHLNERLKPPVGSFTNPMIDYFISRLVDIGIQHGIKNHYTDFCIPILKELKKSFPLQFLDIKSFSNKRLMGRVKKGREIQEEINF